MSARPKWYIVIYLEQLDSSSVEGMPIALEKRAVAGNEHQEHEVAVEQEAQRGWVETQKDSRWNKIKQPKIQAANSKRTLKK